MKRLVMNFMAFNMLWATSGMTKTIYPECTHEYEGKVLRYNANYKFYESFKAGNKDVYMNNYMVYFKNPEYLDRGTHYTWTNDIKKSSYRVPAHNSMRVLDTGKVNWKIVKHPAKRTDATIDSHDFVVMYKFIYDYSNTPNKKSDDISIVDCIYYSVSWCGDGVVDKPDERCDPGRDQDKDICDPKTCQ